MDQIKLFIEKFGWIGFLRFAIYPLTTLVTTPFRLLQSLWNCRILFYGDWRKYPHFGVNRGINNLFYWTRALNLHRYGRAGKSPYLGLGDYNLSRTFHYSLPSLYLFWFAAAPTVLIGMFLWLGAFSIYGLSVDHTWGLIVLLLAMVSTAFYVNTFAMQNYNVIGWIFFPLIVYGLMAKLWVLVAVATFLASFGSFTTVFITCLLSALHAVYTAEYLSVLYMLPAVLKLGTHFIPFITGGDGSKTLLGVMKAIGMNRGKAKYKRSVKGKKIGLVELYHILLISQFAFVLWWFSGEIPVLLLGGLGILIINSAIMRFADEQSIWLMNFTLAVAFALPAENWWVLGSFWLAVSPLPLLNGLDSDKRVLDIVPAMKPYDISPMIHRMENLLLTVPQDAKIFMAFNDPGTVYEKIYDGYRQFIELPSYVANKQKKLLFPEYWGVFELNYEGAPQIWGREVDEVKSNLKDWDANYVMIYQDSNTQLDPKWEQSGFECLGDFDWAEFKEDFKNDKKFHDVSFKWFLLKQNI